MECQIKSTLPSLYIILAYRHLSSIFFHFFYFFKKFKIKESPPGGSIPLKIIPSGTGTGITIHIEDSVLNALLEKVPWTDVLESLNNKLARTEETKHIKEHIYRVANEDDIFDHYKWNNGGGKQKSRSSTNSIVWGHQVY